MIRDNAFQFDDPMGMFQGVEVNVENLKRHTLSDTNFAIVGEKIFHEHCKRLNENRSFLVTKGYSERFIQKTLSQKCWYR